MDVILEIMRHMTKITKCPIFLDAMNLSKASKSHFFMISWLNTLCPSLLITLYKLKTWEFQIIRSFFKILSCIYLLSLINENTVLVIITLNICHQLSLFSNPPGDLKITKTCSQMLSTLEVDIWPDIGIGIKPIHIRKLLIIGLFVHFRFVVYNLIIFSQ